MRKIVIIILTVLMMFTLPSCGGKTKIININDNGWSCFLGRDGNTYSSELLASPNGDYFLFGDNNRAILDGGKAIIKIEEADLINNTYKLDKGFTFDSDADTKYNITCGEMTKNDFKLILDAVYTVTFTLHASTVQPLLVMYEVSTSTGQERIAETIIYKGRGTLRAEFDGIPIDEEPDFKCELVGAIPFEDEKIPSFKENGVVQETIDGIDHSSIEIEFEEVKDGLILIKREAEDTEPMINIFDPFVSVRPYSLHEVENGKVSIPTSEGSFEFGPYEVIGWKEYNVKTDYQYGITGNEEIRARVFKDICKDYGTGINVIYPEDYSYLSVDTNPFDLEDYFDQDAYNTIEKINQELGFSSAVLAKMNRTKSLDGIQEEKNDSYRVTWTYHPDQGLEVMYEEIERQN